MTAPSCAAAASGSTFCGVVGVGGHLLLNQVDNFTSLGYTDLGGIVIGKPSCTHFGIGQPEPLFRVLCGVIGTDSALWVIRFDGSSSSGFTSLGGISISDPACTGLSGLDQSRLRRHRHEQPSFCFNHLGWRQLDGIRGPRPRGNAHIQPDVHGHWGYDRFLRGSDYGRRASANTFSGWERPRVLGEYEHHNLPPYNPPHPRQRPPRDWRHFDSQHH